MNEYTTEQLEIIGKFETEFAGFTKREEFQNFLDNRIGEVPEIVTNVVLAKFNEKLALISTQGNIAKTTAEQPAEYKADLPTETDNEIPIISKGISMDEAERINKEKMEKAEKGEAINFK